MKKHIVVYSIVVFMAVAGLVCGAIAQSLPGPPPPMPPAPAAAVSPAAGAGPTAPAGIGGPPAPPLPGGPAPPPVAVQPPPVGPPAAIAPAVPTQALIADLPRAEATVRELSGRLTPGEVRLVRGPGGEVILAAELIYRGTPVAVLHFDPRDGRLLPLGVPSHAFRSTVPAGAVRDRLAAITRELKVLPAAEFLAPEASWSFPVVRGDAVVARVKVYHDGIHIVAQSVAEPRRISYGR